ncbi:restriction endonuclease subunit S [Bacteroides hominis]|uniref:restriction endonuclease subunit S n=1 Tax=Bacteroides TaxID=816 RepID=UPI0022A9FDC2|nr:restriction endonuclease subunit S [Bacteroides fragilis]MCZ2626299.1 restriction endonuclease subunit S [Bacteroides fragilis]
MNSYYEKIIATGEVKCIDEEIPFEIPKGWEWERWGNISQSIQYGYNAPALEKGVIRMVRISDIQDNKVLWNTVPFCMIEEKDIETYLLEVNDILFARTGGTVGKSFLVEEVPTKSIYAGYLIRTRYSSLLCPHYMKAFMESQLYWEQLKNGTIATAQPNCNGKTLAKMLLPIPPINEQKRIVERLRRISPFIERYSKSQDALNLMNMQIREQFKKSVLQEAIQGKLVPQIAEEGTAQELLEQIKLEKQKLVKEGELKKSSLSDSIIYKGDDNKYYERIGKSEVDISDEISFEIPSTWIWSRLKNVVALNPRNCLDDEFEVGFIPMTYIKAGYLSHFEYSRKKWKEVKAGFTHLADGDVAFAKITPCFQNRKSMIIKSVINGYAAGTTELNVLRPYSETIAPEYLLWFCKSSYFIDEVKMKGTAGQQRVTVDYTPNKLIPLPPKDEQKRIVARIKELLDTLQ